MQINYCEIEGYKSIKGRQIISFEGLNILIGANNSGKSTILNIIKDYKDIFPVDKLPDVDWIESRVVGKSPGNIMKMFFEFSISDDAYENILNGFEQKGFLEPRKIDQQKSTGGMKKFRHFITIDFEVPDFCSAIFVEYDNKWVPFSLFNYDGVSFQFRGESHSAQLPDQFEKWPDHLHLNLDQLPQVNLIKKDLSYSIFFEEIKKEFSKWRSTSAFRVPENSLPVENIGELSEDGKNLTVVLHALRGKQDNRFENISEEYSRIMPGITKIRSTLIGESDSTETTIVVDEKEFKNGFKLSEISSGSKEIMTLITQIILSEGETDLLLIEEPELHLHPGAEKKIYDLISNKLGKEVNTQVIISTHSSVFVDQSDIKNIIKVTREEQTKIHEVKTNEISEELQDLGYSKSGLLQPEAIVFVEGKSDRYILNAISEIFDVSFDDDIVSLVDLEGGNRTKDHARSLVKTLQCFDIPYYFILDSDHQDADSIIHEHVDYVNDNADWWHTTPDKFHAWEEDEIESCLLEAPKIVADVAEVDESVVNNIKSNKQDEEKGSDLMEKIFQEGAGTFREGECAYSKAHDGKTIARKFDEDTIPEEIDEVVDEIISLVQTQNL